MVKWGIIDCFSVVLWYKVENYVSLRDGQISNFVFVLRTLAEQIGMVKMQKAENATMPDMTG